MNPFPGVTVQHHPPASPEEAARLRAFAGTPAGAALPPAVSAAERLAVARAELDAATAAAVAFETLDETIANRKREAEELDAKIKEAETFIAQGKLELSSLAAQMMHAHQQKKQGNGAEAARARLERARVDLASAEDALEHEARDVPTFANPRGVVAVAALPPPKALDLETSMKATAVELLDTKIQERRRELEQLDERIREATREPKKETQSDDQGAVHQEVHPAEAPRSAQASQGVDDFVRRAEAHAQASVAQAKEGGAAEQQGREVPPGEAGAAKS